MKNHRRIELKATKHASQSFQAPDQERIRVRAYQLYEQRGREDGHELEDWLNAESEVTGRAKASAA